MSSPVAGATDAPPVSEPRRPGRTAALWIAGLKTVLLVLAAMLVLVASGQDPAGKAMGAGLAGLAFVYWLILVLPAILLARRDRIGLALALLLVPAPILLLLSLVL